MSSYMGKFLVADLSSGASEVYNLNPSIRDALVGGKGVGARLLYDLVPPDADALGPANALIFMTGPLTGTGAPAMRGCVITRSPLTGTFLDSYFGGHFAPEIKYAGYDGIVIIGSSEKPVYLWVDDGRVEFRDASHLEGADTFAANWSIKDELGDESVKVACIGPAGENLARMALISCEYNRQAGRGGAGAVMGSKNLKAVALRGTHPVMVSDLAAFQKAANKACAELGEETMGDFTYGGTAVSVPFSDEFGLLPSHNYQRGSFEKASSLDDQAQKKAFWLRDLACAGCPIRCSKMGRIRSGRYKGLVSDAVEYELAALLGANLEIGDVKALVHLAERCDALGLDGISAGGVIGFALEAYEKGIITSADTGGIELGFGSVESAEYLLEAIAFRQGGIGELLAGGVKRASEGLGRGSESFAVHIKGLECPAWGPRGVPGMALALATADRGGCHQRAFPVIYEAGGEWKGDPVEQTAVEGKAEMVYEPQNYLAALDTFIKCDFAQYGIGEDTYRELLRAATGKELSKDGLYELGERVWNLVRVFNVRQGFTRKDDILPARFMTEPLPDGPAKGHVISAPILDRLIDEYYELRGWDENGLPKRETLERLGVVELLQEPVLTKFSEED
ncbi:MAG: aldehyde ferredoxin oxidoreductase family protein [bacterium]